MGSHMGFPMGSRTVSHINFIHWLYIATNVRNYIVIIFLYGDGKLIPDPEWDPM